MSTTITGRKQSDGTGIIASSPRTGEEKVIASHNLADRCTWFTESKRVDDETLDTSDNLEFQSDHSHWIDMTSGRVHRQDEWVAKQKAAEPEDPHGYEVIVKVDSVTKTPRAPFATSGGDYEIIWEDGKIIFFEEQTGTVTASYSYSDGSTWVLKPAPGTKLIVEDAEADFSADVVFATAVKYTVYGLVDVFAPELTPSPYPSGTLIPVQDDRYDRVSSIFQEARGAYSQVLAVGATEAHKAISDIDEFRRTSRGMKSMVQPIPFAYSTVRELISSYGLELRLSLEGDIPFEGELASMTYYCTELEDDS